MYPLDQLIECNKLTGYALWEVLTSHVDYSSGCVDNQPQSTIYDETKPQGILLCCIDESQEELPADMYHYRIQSVIQPGVEIAKHLVTLSVTIKRPAWDVIIEKIYSLRMPSFLALYPHLLTPDRDKYLAILEPVDFNEWYPDD